MYTQLKEKFQKQFGNKAAYIFSAPGRTELGGNHTDHQHGKVLAAAVNRVFDARPASIIRTLDLRNTVYAPLAAYGHMGREDLGVRWEKTDRVEALKNALR